MAFESVAANLTSGDTTGCGTCSCVDHVTGTTQRISLASDGTQGNGPSGAPAISDDGRFAAFEIDASNPVPGDGGDDTDVVVRDRQLGTTTLVSTNVAVPPPIDPGEFDATGATISGDCTVVAFEIGVPFQGTCCAPLGPRYAIWPPGPPGSCRLPEADWSSGRRASPTTGQASLMASFGPPNEIGDATFAAVVADTASATVVATVAGRNLSHQAESRFDIALSGDGGTAVFLFVNFGLGTVHRFELAQQQLVPVLDGLSGPRDLRVSDDGGVVAMVVGPDYVVFLRSAQSPRTGPS